ncbi:radical SAM protein, partial [Escherichia coli]|uniref:radical SAM protein n=1 Tax=Escherichia coli TaxID=562 RepID=UPI003C773BA7
CGVSRVSFGVQDFDEKVMESVNRPQLFNVVYKGIQLARRYGMGAVNIDLMYGLPHQSPETMKKLAEQAISLSPDRIALFG